MPTTKNTAQFVLTADPSKLNRTAKRLADHLLSAEPRTYSDALFMYKEFARRRLCNATVEHLVRAWLRATNTERDRVATVLARIGQDIVDYVHRELTRKHLPPQATDLIALLLGICPQDDYEAGLMWELTGHPQANASLRAAAGRAHKLLQVNVGAGRRAPCYTDPKKQFCPAARAPDWFSADSEHERIVLVRHLGDDAVDFFKLQLGSRKRPANRKAMIELVGLLGSDDGYLAHLLLEYRDCAKEEAEVREAARVAYERLNATSS